MCGYSNLVNFCKSHAPDGPLAYAARNPIISSVVDGKYRVLAGFILGLVANGEQTAQTGFNSFILDQNGLIESCTGYLEAQTSN